MSAVRPGRSGFPVGWILLFAVLAVAPTGHAVSGWIGAVAGYLFGRTLSLERELGELQSRLTDIAARLNRDAASTVSEPVSVSPPFRAEAAVRIPAPAEVFAVPAAAPGESSPPSPAPTPLDRARDRIGAWLRGGNPLARLGVLITFFGAVFLIKYAAAEGYLPIRLRLGGVAAAALVMVAIGWRLRHKASAYALTLQGGGLALLYLTVFAAFRFYTLLAPGSALSLLVLVAAASATLALHQNALPLAVIGFTGGFVAPLLIGGDGNHIALFGYYTVLNFGLVAIASVRAWSLLNLLGFVFTFVITALWRVTRYSPELFSSTEFFLLLFFVLYVAVTLLNTRLPSGVRGRVVSGSLSFGLPAVVLSLQASIVRDYPDGLAWSALGFGLFYLALALLLHRSARAGWQLPKQAFIAIGVVLLSLAVPLHYDAGATAATWALEGAGAVWLGVRQQQPRARFFGVVIQLLAALSLLDSLRTAGISETWLATGVPGALLLAAAGALSAVWLRSTRERLLAYEHYADLGFVLWALAWWLFAGYRQLDHAAPELSQGLGLVWVAFAAVLLDSAGRRRVWPQLRLLGAIVILPFALSAGFAGLVRHPFAAGGLYGWPLLFAAHYGLLWRRERDAQSGGAVLMAALHAGALWWLILLGARELEWQIGLTRPEDWTQLAHGILPALILLPIANLQPRWPVAVHDETYRVWAATPVAIGLLVWVLIASLSNAGSAAPLPTWPLLDPLDLTIAGVLAVIALWWQGLASAQRARLTPPQAWWLAAALAFVIFIWLNSALVRGLHYGIGTPLGGHGIRHSATVQAAFSIFWGGLAFAAMVLAARRAQREVWLAGAGLMVVVALKLFAVDTAGTGTLARIVAFLIVGALLLITGYLAPLPPARAEVDPGRSR